jgi:hypothetical protein
MAAADSPRVVCTVTTFDRFEVEDYPHGREAFLSMVANELRMAAGPDVLLEYECEPRAGGSIFAMRARVLTRCN